MSTIIVSSGHTSSKLVVTSSEVLDVYGTATSTVVNAGGQEVVYQGGTVLSSVVAAGGTEILLGGGTLGSVSGAGTLLLSSGGYSVTASDFVNLGQVKVSTATLAFGGAVANTGTISVASGAISIAGAVTGKGALVLGGAGTLSLAGSGAGPMVDFTGVNNLLNLSNPLAPSPVLSGFAATDQIDLLNTVFTGFSFAHDTLRVLNGGSTVAMLAFTGTYTSKSFTVTSDGSGGALIKFS